MYIYTLLTLFALSLLSIIFMIGRKLVLIKHEQVLNHKEVAFELPYFREAKHITVTNMKKHGYTLLVETIRFYVRSTNSLKSQYQKVKTNLNNRKLRNQTNGEKKETSKFLKIIGDYKQKIREIKHKIKKEEKL